ncbi:MAG TPA: DUF4136 domain-containing protein [Vicinamibacterales bacterium]|nr:DUF4136 domain-containing protein [Vicinamibacterales bacterium]
MNARTLGALTVATFVGAVAYADSINAVSDSGAPFSSYKTYAWTAGTTSPDAITERRIHAAVEAQFSGKGIRLAEPDETPTIYVATHVVTREQKDLLSKEFGTSGSDDAAAINAQPLSRGALVVDIYDATSRKIVWRGIATGTGSDGPTKNADKIEKALGDLFRQFPAGLQLPK